MDDSTLDRAVGAMPVYRVGLRFDGTPALSYDGGTPEMDTEVWFADDPGTKMTAFEAADRTDVSWFTDPMEWTGPKVAAAAPPEGYEDLGLLGDADAGDVAPAPAESVEPVGAPVDPVDELTEAELDELSDAVELAETRVGELEALVASVILGKVKDNIFDDAAVTASAPLPVAAAERVHVRAGFSAVGEFLAVVAALGDTLPDDLMQRIDAVTERLDALDESVGKLMLDDVTDEGLPEAPEGASTFIDETLDSDEDPKVDEDADAEDTEDDDAEYDSQRNETDDESEDEDSDEPEGRYPRKKKKRMKAPPFKARGR